MSLYDRNYGPINKHTTMFEPFSEGHPNYVGEDTTAFAKSFVRYDVPRSMQYPGRFDNEEWYSVFKQHASRAEKIEVGLEMEMRRLKNIRKSVNRQGIPRSLSIRLATPSWITRRDRDEIHRMKSIVKKLNKQHGRNTWSVDHIIPLHGELVSGLHIPSNLRIMETKGNTEKGNSYEIV